MVTFIFFVQYYVYTKVEYCFFESWIKVRTMLVVGWAVLNVRLLFRLV